MRRSRAPARPRRTGRRRRRAARGRRRACGSGRGDRVELPGDSSRSVSCELPRGRRPRSRASVPALVAAATAACAAPPAASASVARCCGVASCSQNACVAPSAAQSACRPPMVWASAPADCATPPTVCASASRCRRGLPSVRRGDLRRATSSVAVILARRPLDAAASWSRPRRRRASRPRSCRVPSRASPAPDARPRAPSASCVAPPGSAAAPSAACCAPSASCAGAVGGDAELIAERREAEEHVLEVHLRQLVAHEGCRGRGHLRGDRVVDDEAVGRRLHVDRGALGRAARLRRRRGRREVLGDRDDGRVRAVGEALRGVVGVGDRPGEVARLVVRALDESGGELPAEGHVLVVDRDGLVLVHDRGVQAVEALDRVVERGDEDAADDDGQQQHADEGQPGDRAARARPLDGQGHAVRGHEKAPRWGGRKRRGRARRPRARRASTRRARATSGSAAETRTVGDSASRSTAAARSRTGVGGEGVGAVDRRRSPVRRARRGGARRRGRRRRRAARRRRASAPTPRARAAGARRRAAGRRSGRRGRDREQQRARRARVGGCHDRATRRARGAVLAPL